MFIYNGHTLSFLINAFECLTLRIQLIIIIDQNQIQFIVCILQRITIQYLINKEEALPSHDPLQTELL